MISKLLSNRYWPHAAIVISVLMLATAHGFESFGKMYPCDLCLKQREPYWIAISIGIAAIVLSRAKPNWQIKRIASVLLGFIFLYGAGYAIFHSGVEMGIFHTGCSSVGFDPSMALTLDQPIVVGRCDEPPLVLFGITMANMNAVGSIVFSILSFFAAGRKL